MPTITARKPLKLIPRSDFNVEQFRKEVFTHGLRLQWEMAADCPCERRVSIGGKAGGSRDHRSDCPACRGTGLVYHSPQPILGVVTSAKANPERFAIYGQQAHAMVSVTTLPEHLLGHFDRLTMLDNVIVAKDTRTRAATREALAYQIVTRTLDTGDPSEPTTPLQTTLATLYARWANADGVVQAAVLEEGADFEVTDDGFIDWTIGDIAGTAPPVGTRYSLAYFGRPRYVVVSIPHAYRDTWLQEKIPAAELRNMVVQADCQMQHLTSWNDNVAGSPAEGAVIGGGGGGPTR